MRDRTRLTSIVISVCMCLLAAACGTTVPLTTQTVVQDGQAGVDGLGPTAGSDGLAASGPSYTASGSVSSTPHAGGVVAGGSGTATGSRGGQSGPTPGATSGSGSKAPVKIGVSYVVGQEEGAAALGGEAREDYGSQRVMIEAVIKWINANGGLNGHPVEPVWNEQEFVDNRPWPEKAAAICAAFTQDNKTAAGIFLGPGGVELPQCLNDAGTAFYQWGWTLHTQDDYARIPLMFQPAEFGVERLANTYGEQLVAHGFFGKGAEVGMLVNDYAAAQRGYQILKQTLASRGVALDDANVYTIPQPASFDAIGASLQAIQNAQLKMRASGVTHVLFLCWGCAAFFLIYADSQDWNPTYGFTSQDLLGGIEVNDYASRQLPGSMAVGYWPITDVGVVGEKGAPVNNTWRLCSQILGGTVLTNNDFQNGVAFCSAFLFFKAASEASGASPVTGESIRQGAERLGPAFQDGIPLHTNLRADRHSAVDTVRMVRFNEACTCFEYFGNNILVP